MSETKPGCFFAFEGIDGSGKSTQLRLLADRMKQEGIPCYTTMEPTDGPIGSMIHNILTGRLEADDRVIAALFAADRLDHLLNARNGIAKKVAEGTTVLMDRYLFSSYAYQSVAAPMDWVIALNEESSRVLRPTATIFIDVEPSLAMKRIVQNRSELELFERTERLRSTRDKYLEAFERLKIKETVVTVDGNQPVEALAGQIWEIVRGSLQDCH